MSRNIMITGVVSVVMGLFTLVYSTLAPPPADSSMPTGAASDRIRGAFDPQLPDSMRSERALVLFRHSIRPLLTGICLKCHDSTQRRGGLDLTSRATALAGGETGTSLVPGKPEESLMFQLVTAGEMPKEGPMLSSEQIAALKQWIELGAPYEDEPLTVAGAMRADTSGPRIMGSTVQSSSLMSGSMGPGAGNMMMCPCMQMMQMMMGGSGATGQRPSTSQTAPADSAFFNPRTKQQAQQRAEDHLKSSGNPNLKVGDVNETIASYEIQVVTKDGSLVNWIVIDKQSGQIRTLY